MYRWSLRGGGGGTERCTSPGDIVASRAGDKLGRRHIIAVASTTQSPPPHLGKECITHGLACIHSVIYLMPYIFFLCVHDEILPLFQCHLNFFVAKVFFIFSFSKRLMLEHAFLFFGKGMLTLKCVCTAANPCALEFAVYGSFFSHLVNKHKKM